MTIQEGKRIVSDGGLTLKEMEMFYYESSKLEDRIDSMRRNFHGDISVKDKDKSSQKVTLELWIQGMNKIVSIAECEDLRTAFQIVTEKAIHQVSSINAKKRENS